jgi:predicted HTH domain antitoxin
VSTTPIVTKSIRLDPVEHEQLAHMSAAEGVSEAALMKQFVREGISRYRLEKAISAYRQGEVDLSAAARYAGVSVYRMMTELEARAITPPADAQKLKEGLRTLIDLFGGSDELRQTLDEFEPTSR